jgi:hypothetical protein
VGPVLLQSCAWCSRAIPWPACGMPPPPTRVALLLAAPRPRTTSPAPLPQLTSVYFGNGCFWGRQYDFVSTELALGRDEGSMSAVAGYAGGRVPAQDGKVCYYRGPPGSGERRRGVGCRGPLQLAGGASPGSAPGRLPPCARSGRLRMPAMALLAWRRCQSLSACYPCLALPVTHPLNSTRTTFVLASRRTTLPITPPPPPGPPFLSKQCTRSLATLRW